MVAAVKWCAGWIPWARFKAASQRFVNRMPAILAVLLFGVPLVVSEFGSFLSVVAIALGHVVMGTLAYIGMKIIGVGLVAVIFDITREKLMTLPWFVVLYDKFVRSTISRIGWSRPTKRAAVVFLKDLRERARQYWLRFAGAGDGG